MKMGSMARLVASEDRTTYAADRHLAQFDMTYYMYLLVHFTTSNMTPILNPFHKV